MALTDEFGEELADFVRRVSELKAARSVPARELPTVLEAAIFELDHVAEQLWPAFQRMSDAGPSGIDSVDRQEQQLLKALFQRVPVPVVLVDRETVVRRMNFAATSFTGLRAGYATGRPLTGFLAHADRAAFRSQAAAVARGEGDRGLTVRLQQEPSVPVRATLTALRPSGEPRTAVLVVLQPVDEGSPSDSPGHSGDSGPGTPGRAVPSLSATTRHAELMDLVDAMTTALLGRPDGDRSAVLDRAAGVLHGRFADWVVADAGAGPGRLSRTAVLGPPGCGEEVAAVAAQDPAACPLVAEAVRGGSPALRVRPDDPDAFGHDASGAPVLVRADVTSLLCVPLLSGASGSVRGVVTLFRSGGRLAFSMAEAQAMDLMSRHIALRLSWSD
ncbi:MULTISPECIES: PAS domain-containing protein [unclassified Streptomyces]|uniref:PAS domain-containing protein n=1 Tax=unclassified Streptomyces TaxID=2593676 RepID=UPI00225064E2|nr:MULTISPECIES: PAS domain-containing protein [unclassified Streptomyces]MCX4987504.1 PAS domain-containing protein [Streptomyces sp. NBC_00568]MCX5007363.1 PAS domain-containing protein [Streptomyces sp. NBC_00638]